MNTTEFQHEFLSRATLPTHDSADSLITGFIETRRRTMAQAEELGVGSAGLRDIGNKTATAFVRRWMMLRYAALDLSFAKRPWWLTVDRTGGNTPTIVAAADTKPDGEVDPVTTLVASIPRFFRASCAAHKFAFGDDDDDFDEGILTGGRVDAGTLLSGRRKSDSYRTLLVTVHAKLPDGLGRRHVKLVQEAIGHFHCAVALLYARGINIESDLAPATRYESRKTNVEIIWAPAVEVLTLTAEPPRPAGDPAVVFSTAGHSFLLDFYDTPDEQPIEHLIREFSEGKL